jgi:transcription termination factor NusB
MRLHSVVCKLVLLFGLSFFTDGLLSSKNLPRASCTRKLSSEFASLRAGTTSDVSNRGQPKSPKRKPKVKPTPRSMAVFALMDGAKRKPTFAIRRLENDRSFARSMLSTSERRQGQIDKVIQKFVHQSKKLKVRQGDLLVNQKHCAPDGRLPNPCLHQFQNSPTDLLCEATLRIGAAQLLFLDVPPYAAVQETVEVLRMHPKIKVSYVDCCRHIVL